MRSSLPMAISVPFLRANDRTGCRTQAGSEIFKDTCRIDFHKPAKQVYDFIRGLSPYPGAWTEIKKKETVVFFDDPKGDDDYVRFPEPTTHPSHKQSTQKFRYLRYFLPVFHV